MLNDATGFEHIYLACGYTDLRQGIDGLAAAVKNHFNKDPYAENTLYLFCGRKTDRIKGLLFEGDGFVLLYKRFTDGRLHWPRKQDEVKDLTPEEYHLLMTGFSIVGTVKLFTPKQM
jgi:transposase